ncbi:MAG: thioredoxin family protein [Bacteroidota bacterium]
MLTNIREHFLFLYLTFSMVKLKIYTCLLLSLFIYTSMNAQVFLDDDEPTTDKTNVIETIIKEEDGTNINEMLNIDTYKYDTIDQKEKKYKQEIYIAAPKPAANVTEEVGHKKTFVDGTWADFLRLIDTSRRNYFVQFSAVWCGPCKMMENVVFNKEPIIDFATRYYYAKMIDIEDFDGIQITQDLNVKNVPTTIIFDCDGNELKRVEGFINENMFLELLKKYE